jgi:flagellar export protein FliJ
MPVPAAMRRLLRVRQVQEEESRAVLEKILRELNSLKAALRAASEWECKGRQIVSESMQSGELRDRLAGQVQEHTARQAKAFLAERIAAAEEQADESRQSYRAACIRMRQVSTLIEKVQGEERLYEARRQQNNLDDWYRLRQRTRS